jgi:hypothetical protein
LPCIQTKNYQKIEDLLVQTAGIFVNGQKTNENLQEGLDLFVYNSLK